MISSTILPVVEGQIFVRLGSRYVFRGVVGERLHCTSDSGEVLIIDDENLDAQAMPTPAWFLQEYINGDIVIPPTSKSEEARFARLERLDILASTIRDPRCLWRYTWATSAKAAGLKQNEAAMRAWIAKSKLPEIPALAWQKPSSDQARALNKKLARIFSVKPAPRSLMVWMKKLDDGAGRIAALINKAGRPLGHSQLPSIVDQMVDCVAQRFYDEPDKLPTIEDAAALAKYWWDISEAEGHPDIGGAAPEYETVRRRVRRKENFENYAKRYGRAAALAKFAPKGEPIPVSQPFELVFMDGVEFEHYTLYSDEWREVAGKMKGVAAMDAYSLFKWPYAIFYGPYRPQMSAQALMNVLVGQRADEADLEADPSKLIFGIPATVSYDNDKALLPPSLVTALSQQHEIVLNGVYHPNGKSALEGSFRHDKGRLKHIKGRVLAPSKGRDPRYDPKKEANLTKEQYRVEVERARLNWNRTGKRRLGGRSPNEVMLDYLTKVGVQRYHA